MARNKVNIIKKKGSYQNWLDQHEGFDTSSAEILGEAASPFYVQPLPSGLEDIYERLEALYYDGHVKGRQKQIVNLLLEGETNQLTIAKCLNMKQSNVSIELKKIREKLSKKII